ncbi:hypothetical protein [Algicola sagamiensis]|uniref:hypothetical protein n=1 Tax=Algicola sagamiensis TaxID=163869 RepID=UPI000375ABC6|nr:hypothetical protein [Algicola sagamiensis]
MTIPSMGHANVTLLSARAIPEAETSKVQSQGEIAGKDVKISAADAKAKNLVGNAKSEHIDRPKGHLPFRGVRVWLATVSSMLVSSLMSKLGKPVSASVNTEANTNKIPLEAHVNALLKSCKKDGDAMLLSFNKGMHSALAVYDAESKPPITRYFSMGAPGYNSSGRGAEFGLYDDMANYGDRLTKDGEITSDNVVRLEGINAQKVISAWKEMEEDKFNLLSNNCSAYVRDLLVVGYEDELDVDPKTLKHNRSNWQMPANTHAMAIEMKQLMQGAAG